VFSGCFCKRLESVVNVEGTGMVAYATEPSKFEGIDEAKVIEEVIEEV